MKKNGTKQDNIQGKDDALEEKKNPKTGELEDKNLENIAGGEGMTPGTLITP